MANPKCLPRLPWPKWAEEAGLSQGYKSTDNWHAFERWAQLFLDECLPAGGGFIPWGIVTNYEDCGDPTFLADTVVEVPWTKVDRSDDFDDWFTSSATGFDCIQSCLVMIGYALKIGFPGSWDIPRTGGGAIDSPFQVRTGINLGGLDQDIGTYWPQTQDTYTADVASVNMIDAVDEPNSDNTFIYTATTHAMFKAGSDNTISVYAARSRNDGAHNGTDLGGFTIGMARLWIYVLGATDSSAQPVGGSFVQEFF